MKKSIQQFFGIGCALLLLCFHSQVAAQKPDTNFLPGVTICSNDLPYSYGGQKYYKAGIYYVHFVGSSGQDSVCRLSLSVHDSHVNKLWAGLCENTLKSTGYTYNGKTYKQSGIYTDTLRTVYGCDSIIQLTINSYNTYNRNVDIDLCQGEAYEFGGDIYGQKVGTFKKTLQLKTFGCHCDSVINATIVVKPAYNQNETLQVCESSLPYNWHGINLYTSGNYKQNFYTKQGCDSVFQIDFSVNPSFSSSDQKTVCADELKEGFVYGNDTITKIGIYNVHFTATNGCDSVVTLKVNEGRLYFENREVTICANEAPYIFNGGNYYSSIRDTAFLTSQSGCDSIIALYLKVLPAYERKVDASICEKDLPYRYGNQEFTASGVHDVQFYSQNGCDSIIHLNLTVYPSYEKNVQLSVCGDALPYTFDANNIFTNQGKHTISYRTINGCDSIVHVNFSVNPTYTHMDEVTLCHEQDFPFRYGDSLFQQGGYYTVVMQTVNGCDSTILLRINEHFVPADPDSIYGDEKIGKEGVFKYATELVDNNFPTTHYEWTCSNPYWNIVNHNREGNGIYLEIPNRMGYGEADLTVQAINDCGESAVITKHIKSYINTAIRIYPNPTFTNDHFTVEFNDMKGENIIRITDAAGNILHQESIRITDDHQEVRFSTADYPSGEYFLRVSTEKMNIIKKLVIINGNGEN